MKWVAPHRVGPSQRRADGPREAEDRRQNEPNCLTELVSKKGLVVVMPLRPSRLGDEDNPGNRPRSRDRGREYEAGAGGPPPAVGVCSWYVSPTPAGGRRGRGEDADLVVGGVEA